MNIIFFGTNQFAVPALQNLAKYFNIALVITKPAKPVGRKQELRPSTVEIEARKLGLNVISPENLYEGIIEKIKEANPLFYVVVDYGKIISKKILDIPEKGAINIHPSKLPKYRGASPIQTAILNGEKETAISIMLMDEETDHGPILAKKNIYILSDDTYGSLYKKLSYEYSEFLVNTIKKYLSGEIKPQEQNHKRATFTKILKREDGRIDWNKSAEEIERMVRAYHPWPGTFCEHNGKKIKILFASVCRSRKGGNLDPGKFFKTPSGELAITCGQNTTLLIHNLQPEGKKPMTGEEFIQGYLK